MLGPAIVIAVVLLANAAYLVRYTDPNPLGPRGALAASVVKGPLPGERTIDPNNGFITQAIGRQAAHQIRTGAVPLWNPYEGAGSPLLANAQSAALFPPTMLNLLSNGLFYETLLLELVAGLSTYFLMLRLRVHEFAAVAAGAAFALNGTFAWLQNGAMLPVAFLPLVLLGVERARDRSRVEGGSRGGWVMIAVAIALGVFAGFVETVYIYGLLVGAWTVLRLVELDRTQRRRFATKVASGVAAGALLAAPLLIPFAGYLGVADVGGHEGVFSTWTLPSAALPTVMGMPYAFGPIFAFTDPQHLISTVWGNVGGFLSATLVMLAIIGTFGRRERGLRLVLVGWIAFCVAKTWGPDFFVRIVNHIPGMNSVAFYRYMSPSLSMAVVVLAGLAIDDMVSGKVSKRRLAIGAACTSGLLVIAALVARNPVQDAPGAHRYLVLSFVWGLVVTGTIVVVALVLRGGRLAVGVCAVLVVDVVVMFAVPTLSAPRAVATDTRSVAWLQANAGVQRFFTYGPIAANYGSYFDIGSAAASDLPIPRRWSDWLKEHLGPATDPVNLPFLAEGQASVTANPDVLRSLAVSYVVTGAHFGVGEPLNSALTLVHRDSVADVYSLSGARPYFDVKRASCRVVPRGREEVRVTCTAPTRLVRRETYVPEWSATVNGQPTTIEVADGLFQAVRLPAGTSVVRFSYTPARWTLTIVAFALGVLWVLVALVLRATGVDARSWRMRSRLREPEHPVPAEGL